MHIRVQEGKEFKMLEPIQTPDMMERKQCKKKKKIYRVGDVGKAVSGHQYHHSISQHQADSQLMSETTIHWMKGQDKSTRDYPSEVM